MKRLMNIKRMMNMKSNPLRKLLLIASAIFLLSACAQGVDAAKRLEKCVVDGNQNNNCELSTLEGNSEQHQ